MKGSTLASVILVLGSAASFLLVPYGEVRAVYTGPTVQVSTMTEMVEAGSETEITVTCSNNDGGSLDLMSVSISATLGSCSPNGAISDQNGDCHFTYHAPSNVPGPTSVTITAVMENGLFDASGSKDLIVSYHISGEIIGPNLVRVGSPDVHCMVHVKAGDRPLSGANLNPTVLGFGSYVSHSSTTNSSGDALLVVSPSAVASGQISIMVQVNKVGYISTTLSKGITVSQTLDPLVLTVVSDRDSCKRWGSRLLTATVMRGGVPEPGISISWSSNKGTMFPTSTTTASNGTSRSYMTAGGSLDGTIAVNVTATQNAETVYFEIPIEVEPADAKVVAYIRSHLGNATFFMDPNYALVPKILEKRQYFPGEDMVLNVYAVPGYGSELVNQVRSWFVLSNPVGQEVLREDLGTGCSLDEVVFDFGPKSIYTVPELPLVGNYSCSIIITDPRSVHTYYVYEVHDKVRILREGKDDWTFMYYFAGDNNLADWMDREISALEDARPHGKFKVYVLYDRHETVYDDLDGSVEWCGTRRFDLDRGLAHAEEYPTPQNSGDWQILLSFMTWAADCSPAGHYCIVLCDHGAAHEGVCFQERDRPLKNINLKGLKQELGCFSAARRMTDVIVFSACNMASLEVAAHISMDTKYQVFSQKVMWTEHAFDCPQVLDRLRNGYDWGTSGPQPLQVANTFLDGFNDVAGGTPYDCPVALVDSPKVDGLVKALDSLCRIIYYNWDLLGDCMVQAFEEMWRTDGPYAEQTNLADLRGFIGLVREGLSEYIMTLPGRAAYGASSEFMASFDEAIVEFLPMEEYKGLNIFLPVNRRILEYSDQFVDLNCDSNYWFKSLKAICTGRGGVSQLDDIQPLQLDTPYTIDEDSNGLNDGFGFAIRGEDISYEHGWSAVVTMSKLITTYGGRLLNETVSAMKVVPLDDVGPVEMVNMTAPSNGSYIVHLRVIDPDGQVVQETLVGNATFEGSPNGGTAPILEVAGPSEVSVGEELSFVATASDIEGDPVDVWWDMDTRNGLGLDGVGHDMNWSYRLSGNTSMVCFASDSSHITVKEIPIIVVPVQGNNAPDANLSISKNGLAVQLLAANPMNTSLDPDGDRLQYRFNFGDGNMTGWVDDPGILHVYPRSGIFTVSLKVRDHRGGESERYFLDLELFKVPNSAPLFIISGSTNIEIEDWSPMTPLYLNPIIVDRDGDPITINISWGDGCSETYSYPPEEDVRYNHTYADYGTYIITVTASDDEGNEDSLNYTVHLLKVDEGRTDQDPPIFLIMIAIVALVTLLLIIVLVLVLISMARYRVDEE